MEQQKPQSAPVQRRRNRPTFPVRFVVALGFLALAVAAISLYRHFWHGRPVGDGPAGPPVPREVFLQPWTERPVLLVGIGDSITAGFGARKGYGYFDRLVANPPDEFEDLRGVSLRAAFPNLQITNLAVSGSTSIEHVQKQFPRIPTAASDVFGIVVMTTGGNDVIHDYGRSPPREGAMYGATWEQAQHWIASFEQRLDWMVTEIISRFPGGCEIFLADIYDPTDGVGDIERAGLPPWRDGLKILDAYNGIIRRCAEKHSNVHLIDLHRTFLGHGIHCTRFWAKHYDRRDPHYWYYENLEDPNERGYDAIRRLFLIEIGKVAHRWK
jgi:lysophospholipase L1-like esterase